MQDAGHARRVVTWLSRCAACTAPFVFGLLLLVSCPLTSRNTARVARMAAGIKRTAPDDFDSPAAPHPSTRSRPSTESESAPGPSPGGSARSPTLSVPISSSLNHGATANAWVRELENRVINAEQGGVPDVVLGTEEARDLLETMRFTVEGCACALTRFPRACARPMTLTPPPPARSRKSSKRRPRGATSWT